MIDCTNTTLDPIYVALVSARDKLVNDFAFVKLIYGDAAYAIAMEKLKEEHDALLAEIDSRIERRILLLAVASFPK